MVNTNCELCGSNLPADARFCPGCGTPISDVAGAPPVEFPATIHEAERHPLGLAPAQLLGGLCAMACVLALLLFVAGAWIAGVLLGLGALLLAALLLRACRHEPHTEAARVVLRASDRAGSMTRLAAVTARAWSQAALRLLRVRRRQRRLYAELHERMKPLGEAVYQDNRRLTVALREHASELDEALGETEREHDAVVRVAQHEIERERATARPTEVLRGLRGS